MKGELGMPPGGVRSTSRDHGTSSSNEAALYHAYTPAPPYAFEPRTPVVSAHTNSYNISTAASNHGLPPPISVPWTADEHDRFLNALERYGANVQFTSPEIVWRAITQAVHTRAVHDVKVHASQYFMELQLANTQRRNEHLFMQSVDARWTPEDDARFEQLLADHATGASDAAVCYPWARIAAEMPGKTPRDVQERYHKLCYDIARVEAGQHVMMSYGGRLPRTKHATAEGDAATKDDTSSEPAEQAQGWDCVVTLTADEETMLMEALAQAHVSPRASPQLLESIASAMAALTNARNKIPPQRASARFTLDDAREVFDELLQEEHPAATDRDQAAVTSAEAILELLVHRLHMQPQHQSNETSNNNQDSGSESARSESALRSSGGRPLKPFATAGLAFGDASPLPLYSPARFFVGPPLKSDASQRGAITEDLLSFRAASSGSSGGGDSGYLGGGSLQRQQQQQGQQHLQPSSANTMPPFSARHRELQSLFSPSNSSAYSTASLPSPFPHRVASFTPRAGAAGGGGSAGGSSTDGAGARGGRLSRAFDAERDDDAQDRRVAGTTREVADDSDEDKEDADMRDFCM